MGGVDQQPMTTSNTDEKMVLGRHWVDQHESSGEMDIGLGRDQLLDSRKGELAPYSNTSALERVGAS